MERSFDPQFVLAIALLCGTIGAMWLIGILCNRSECYANNRSLMAENASLSAKLADAEHKYAVLVDSLREDCMTNAAKRMRDIPIPEAKAPYLELYRTLVSLTAVLLEDEHARGVEAFKRSP